MAQIGGNAGGVFDEATKAASGWLHVKKTLQALQ
jgi:hypothetical protein